MKKVLALILALACVFSLAACGGSAAPAASGSEPAAAPASSGSPSTSSKPSGTYVGYYYGKVFSTVTFYADGSFTEKMEGESETWYGTWVIEGNQITSTYSDGSHDYYTWDPVNDTLDWKGEGRIIYRKVN